MKFVQVIGGYDSIAISESFIKYQLTQLQIESAQPTQAVPHTRKLCSKMRRKAAEVDTFDRIDSKLDQSDSKMDKIMDMLRALLIAKGIEFDESSTSNSRNNEEVVPVKLNLKHNDQEMIHNRKEDEEVREEPQELLEEVVHKRKKRKSNKRRKKTPSQSKGNSRLKCTKNRRKKMTPRLKRKSNKKGSKARTGMKTGTRKKPVNSKRKERLGIKAVKEINLQIHGSYLE